MVERAVHEPLTAGFAISDATVAPATSVAFTDAPTGYDTLALIRSFGSGNTSTEQNSIHTYTHLVLQAIVGLREQPHAGTDRFCKTDVHQNGVIEVGDALFIAQHNVGLRDVWFKPL